MAHLSPDQFVDLADGVLVESDVPHLGTCAACQEQLATLRAMMTEAANVDAPEPSPLFWDQLSSRVRDAVAEEASRRRSWREHLLQPRIWIPSLAAAFAVLLLIALQPRESLVPAGPATIPSTPLPIGERAGLPSLQRSAPLGTPDDPQLDLVADYGTTLSWDEMRDEMALSESGSSSDAVLDVLTVDEQRELQRLLADEMSQPVPETRS